MSKKTFQIGLDKLMVKPFGTEEPATHIAGIKSAEISVEMNTVSFYSDDIIAETFTSLSSLGFSIDVTNLTAKERELLLGETVVKGAIASNVNDVAPYVTVGFRSKKANGEYRFTSIAKLKFSAPTESYATMEGEASETVLTMEATGVPMDNGLYKIQVDSDAEGVDAEYVSTFLEKLPTELPKEAPAVVKSK